MTKLTTIRLPEDLVEEIDEVVRNGNLERSSYLREILKKGFMLDKQERLFQKYAAGEYSLSELSRELKMDPWTLLDGLRSKHLHLNVHLEDFLDSSGLST